MKIINNINILLKYKFILIDQWGVIHDGKKSYIHAIKALEFLKRKGKKIILISNAAENVAYNKNKILKKLKINKKIYDYSITSGELFEKNINWIKKKLNKNILNCYLISHIQKNYLKKFDLRFVSEMKSIDFILACSIKPDTKIQSFKYVLKKCAQKKKLMICINPDKKVFDGKVNKLVWQVGKLAEFYEKIGGKVVYFGKPYPIIFKKCLNLLKSKNKKETIIVGDSIENDILGGQNFGIDTMLVKNGKHKNQLSSNKISNIKKKIIQINPKKKLPTYLIEKFLY